MTPPKSSYIAARDHAVTVSGGATFAPGEAAVGVNPDNPHDADLIAEGRLIATAEAASAPPVSGDSTDEELMVFVKDANVSDVVAAATDAELATRLLAAENSATDDSPRKGIVDGLTPIADTGDTDKEQN